jgi:Protein of unknown function (DUF2585)
MTLDGFVPPLIVIGATLAAVLARFGVAGRPWRVDAAAAVLLTLLTGGLERQMGRPLTYRNGPVRAWSGDISSDQNSQQVADPYTFTHITHGALFYGLTRLVLPSASVGPRFVLAIGLEGAWEAYENTRTVIERYRAVTISLGYFGDSVLNSVCDIVACMIGFWLTARLPRWATIGWIVVVEVALAFWIRDNLTLNILMLVYPLDAIRTWQAGV